MHEKHASAPLPRRAIDSRHRFVAVANSDLLASPENRECTAERNVGNRIGSDLARPKETAHRVLSAFWRFSTA
jgi:hypothetical protein